MSESDSTRQSEAHEYLKEHRILDLFDNMTSQLIYNRPDDPKKFLIESLEKLQKSRATRLDFPCLFDDTNIQSVFGMLDPTNRGYINKQQYMEALTTLGIREINESPDGGDEDKITFDTFLREARQGLSDASATFQH